jgi:hypothetical protein
VIRWVWAGFGAVAVATAVTYWRLPAGATYHFDDTGASGAASRVVTYLSFPVALAAILVLLAVRRDRWAALAAVLCATAAVPGVVRTSDLTARWVNAPSAVGVVLALALGLRSTSGGGRGGADAAPAVRPWQGAAIAVLAVWSLPWLIAACGLYAQDLPLLGHLVRSSQPSPGNPSLASVHRGLHDGLFGAQLAATAVLLWRWRVPLALSAYRSLLAVYGLLVTAQDGWNEQVVKRGWSSTKLPDVLQPEASWAWLAILVVAGAITATRARPHAGARGRSGMGLSSLSVSAGRAHARNRAGAR